MREILTVLISAIVILTVTLLYKFGWVDSSEESNIPSSEVRVHRQQADFHSICYDLALDGLQRLEGCLKVAERDKSVVLNLSNLGLKQIPVDAFKRLSHLTTLNLSSNKLSKLPLSITSDLSNLKTLYLDQNQFDMFPSAVFQMKGLQLLSIGENQLIEVPAELNKLAQLEVLILKGNSLSELPHSLSALTQLRYLDLSENLFRTIPDSLRTLSELEYMNLGNNPLNNIDGLLALNSLKGVGLGWTGLSVLPASISQLKKLQFIKLNGNALTTLPETLAQLPALQKNWIPKRNIGPTQIDIEILEDSGVTASMNNIQYLSADFCNIWIDITNNPLSQKSFTNQCERKNENGLNTNGAPAPGR
ncbi:leucine rich repeat protein [Oleiphilus messinensis]|uniref:Leucine rich repeat protein n=1 Tax=Oleiphilus messinensis TaxID=141451 RepID=A0A1Y0I4D3_9GAMM|nr:hypothetical protein [Oleiphilus messinensis]ARU55368.1 leucine rich repeat protein [Oleiphilus messinensis]